MKVATGKLNGTQRGSTMVVNLTPAIDITFLLLIFFIVSTRFASPEGILPSAVPSEQGVLEASPLPISPIRIRIAAVGNNYTLSIDNWRNQPATFDELSGVLVALQRTPGFDETTPIIIFADDAVEWDHVANCFNAIHRVGTDEDPAIKPFEHISFAASQEGAQ